MKSECRVKLSAVFEISNKTHKNKIMAMIPVDIINNLFGVVLKNAELIGDLVREMETIDQIWYMMVSF